MEDVIYYIALGAIITLSLVRKAGKKNAKRHQRVDMPTPTTQDAGAALSTLLAEIDKMAKEAAKEAQRNAPSPQNPQKFEPVVPNYHYKEEAQSLETIVDEIEIYKMEQAKKAKAAKKAKNNANNSNKPAAAPTTAAPVEPQNKSSKSDNSENSKEFDLREAVIYAEILKPKFEE